VKRELYNPNEEMDRTNPTWIEVGDFVTSKWSGDHCCLGHKLEVMRVDTGLFRLRCHDAKHPGSTGQYAYETSLKPWEEPMKTPKFTVGNWVQRTPNCQDLEPFMIKSVTTGGAGYADLYFGQTRSGHDRSEYENNLVPWTPKFKVGDRVKTRLLKHRYTVLEVPTVPGDGYKLDGTGAREKDDNLDLDRDESVPEVPPPKSDPTPAIDFSKITDERLLKALKAFAETAEQADKAVAKQILDRIEVDRGEAAAALSLFKEESAKRDAAWVARVNQIETEVRARGPRPPIFDGLRKWLSWFFFDCNGSLDFNACFVTWFAFATFFGAATGIAFFVLHVLELRAAGKI
jgi:hypothetical protein